MSLLTILIPTLGQRRDLLKRLLADLMPQVKAAAGAVDVLAYWDNGETSLAVKRQALVEAAAGDYLCFIDDDDTVSGDYVSSLLDALSTRPDYVGFLVDVYRDGQFYGHGSHSLEHGGWFDRADGLMCRDITHRNPIPASVARAADFSVTSRGVSEDRPWADQLRAGGLLRREVMVPRVLYHLWWLTTSVTWQDPDRIAATDPAGKRWRRLPSRPHFAYLEP